LLASLAGVAAVAALVTGGVLRFGSGARPQAGGDGTTATTAVTTATTRDVTATSASPAARPTSGPARRAVPAATRGAAPATVSVKVTSSPVGAEIWLDGDRDHSCRTPCSLDVPRGDRRASLNARHDGYQDRSEPLIPDRDYDIELRLAPMAPAGPGAAAPATRPAVPGARPAAPGASRRPHRPAAPAARTGTDEELLGPRGF